MIDLGDGRHGALAATAGVALLDADRGGDARDQVYLGTGKLLHELPGIGVHGIQKAPLPLGKEDVKRQRALAGSAHAGEHHELPPRNRHREILEVMLACALDEDALLSRRRHVCFVQHSQSITTGFLRCKKYVDGKIP